ncbi:HPr family phosphocarrier protein [Alteromonas lipotrueiana]|uniref:HPr family phosphocarrier protein n=1 Tax=Alteromonas lipotrueiana TaxID=2803815 RepID=UPI001C494EFC|nr:HPr family phosphocarrier protein [Alteromonas lipotrueiana]|tara:strand:- start:268 stop:540 length:273 start_codon:yes stop_codon:yes gene_type:complete
MMVEKQLTIVNKLGLHARAATQLVQLANQFDAQITLIKEDKTADANSVLGLMMLESHQGEQVKVVSEGPDAEAAMDAIETLIAGRFNEAE